MLYERVLLWDTDNLRDVREIKGAVDDELAWCIDACQYAEFLIGAWCFSLTIDPATRSSAAVGVARRAVGKLPKSSTVLRLYEQLADSQLNHSLVQVVDWRSSHPRRRAGVPQAYAVSDRWIVEGLVGFLLARSSDPNSAGLIFPAPTPHSPPPTDVEVSAIIARIMESDLVREDVLGIDRGHSDLASERVRDIFRQRRKQYKIDQLVMVVKDPIPTRVAGEFVQSVSNGVTATPGWRELILGSAELPRREGRTVGPLTLNVSLPKSSLLPAGQTLEWSESFVVGLREQEKAAILGWLDQNVPVHNTARAFSELPGLITEAVETLRARGFRASLVIIPPAERAVASLFGRPSWELAREDGMPPTFVGRWAGLTVVKGPDIGSDRLIVTDREAFFGVRAIPDGDRVQVNITEPDMNYYAEWVTDAESQSDDAKIRCERGIAAEIAITMQSEISFGDMRAAMAISLDAATLGVATQDGIIYHRPSCSELRELASTKFTFRRGRMAPCPKCHPDNADYEPFE
jgi:hypothetical protein